MTDAGRCPICGREVPAGDDGKRCRPFCSPRCRTVDLAGWLEGRYRIGSARDDEEADAPSAPEGEHAGSS